MALVLIEGIDRSGKSTLARALASELAPASVAHFSAPKHGDAVAEYAEPLAIYRPGEARLASQVLDRGHIGEAVWPEFFGRDPLMSWRDRQWLELFYMSRGAVYVHADRDQSELEQAWVAAEERGEPEPLDAGLIEAARVRYHEAMADAGPPIVEYNHQRLAELAPLIAETARNQERFAAPGLRITGRWVGNHRPAALLVAPPEALGAPGPDGAPFDRLMALAGKRWRETAVAAPGEPQEMRDLWSYLGQPHVATAGDVGGAVDMIPEYGDPPF